MSLSYVAFIRGYYLTSGRSVLNVVILMNMKRDIPDAYIFMDDFVPKTGFGEWGKWWGTHRDSATCASITG